MRPERNRGLTLGALARQSGLARSSILHYEALGLLHPRSRSAANYRLYGPGEVERLRTIRQFRDAGLTLSEIGALLSSPHGAPRPGRPTPADLLEKRLLLLCQEAERVRRQQRLVARLLADPALRKNRAGCSKDDWVALLARAGFDGPAMRTWHCEFERDDPDGHAAFLDSLGLDAGEIDAIRRGSRG